MADIKHIVLEGDEKLPTYAWPGGYPMFYTDKEFDFLCPDCANDDERENIVEFEINWEDDDLYCNNCNKRIESAYGEKED